MDCSGSISMNISYIRSVTQIRAAWKRRSVVFSSRVLCNGKVTDTADVDYPASGLSTAARPDQGIQFYVTACSR